MSAPTVAPPEGTAADAPTCLLFDIEGMDCADCARTIESGVRALPGVASAELSFGSATLRVEPKPLGANSADVIKQVERSGYRAALQGVPRESPPNAHRRVFEIAAASLLWIAAFSLDRFDRQPWLAVAMQVAAMTIAGHPVARAALQSIKLRRADMNLLMAIAAIGAAALGQWEEGASVLILFAIGLWLQSTTLARTRRSVRALMDQTPREAFVLRDGCMTLVPVEQIDAGETVFVKPGERIPIDGTVTDGRSSVDQSPITGESVLAPVSPGSRVFAGSINADGALHIRAERAAADTTLARIIRMIEEAQASRAPAQAFVDRFAATYTPAVVISAIAIAAGGAVLSGDAREWMGKALILLVVACPCALVISTPVALVTAIGAGSKRGVLFKGGAALEALADVRIVAFDKTGTLTEGRPSVVGIFPAAGIIDEERVLARAASIEQGANHPLARGILAAASARDLPIPPAVDHRAIPGRGASARLDGELSFAGSRALFGPLPDFLEERLGELERRGQTVMLIGVPDRVDGLIALADPARRTTVAAIQELAKLGVESVMLSGDNQRAARSIGAELGISEVVAGLLPEQKVGQIRELQRRAMVAMVGDGINDGPALASADVGVALSAAGADVALEAAGIALTNDDLRDVPLAIMLSRATMRTIKQNVTVSILVKAAFLALTLLGLTNLWLAVLADTGMSLLVTFNSLRLVRFGRATQ